MSTLCLRLVFTEYSYILYYNRACFSCSDFLIIPETVDTCHFGQNGFIYLSFTRNGIYASCFPLQMPLFPLLFLQLTSFPLSTPEKAIIMCFMCNLYVYEYIFYIHKYYLCNITLCSFFFFCYAHQIHNFFTCCIIFLGVHYILLIHFSSDDTQISTTFLPPQTTLQ